jgi:Flp pilus assembly pilin Flp
MLFLPGEEGQGLLEYGLVIILAAIAVVAILLLLGPAIGNLYSTAMEELPF